MKDNRTALNQALKIYNELCPLKRDRGTYCSDDEIDNILALADIATNAIDTRRSWLLEERFTDEQDNRHRREIKQYQAYLDKVGKFYIIMEIKGQGVYHVLDGRGWLLAVYDDLTVALKDIDGRVDGDKLFYQFSLIPLNLTQKEIDAEEDRLTQEYNKRLPLEESHSALAFRAGYHAYEPTRNGSEEASRYLSGLGVVDVHKTTPKRANFIKGWCSASLDLNLDAGIFYDNSECYGIGLESKVQRDIETVKWLF